MTFLIVISTFLFLTGIGFGIFLLYKILQRLNTETAPIIIERNNITENSIRTGFKSALLEYENERDQERVNLKHSKSENGNMGIYSSGVTDVRVEHAGGNLVPFGLTDEEKENLKMFYDN